MDGNILQAAFDPVESRNDNEERSLLADDIGELQDVFGSCYCF
jgi:hypothetical protein